MVTAQLTFEISNLLVARCLYSGFAGVRRTPSQIGGDVPFLHRTIKQNHKKVLKIIVDVYIDFLSQISKLSHFSLLDLADFFMHH